MVAADSKAKFLHDAERYVLHGKVQQAIGEYLKIVRFDPNDVLILNTVGDLYLRQGNRAEANRYFSQVAEIYVRNNFFLKAIAVYKKILTADPNSLEINSTMASLYAKQGLSIDARNQYLRVATLLEKEGRGREALEVLEKVVELDPSNSVIQRKLAQLYDAEGAEEKALMHWAGAARAQSKAGHVAEAIESFRRAMMIDPLDVSIMKGLLDCCSKAGNPAPALEQLQNSLEKAPDDVDFLEMLGHAQLANNDFDAAVKTFQTVLSKDESRYQNFLQAAQVFIDKREYERAVAALDNIIPVLITQRETDRAAQFYQMILDRSPENVLSMVKLAAVYSATGDREHYLDMLDRVAEYHIENKRWIEAVEYLEKILKSNPESSKHKKLHREVFAEAYPDTPYSAPVDVIESGHVIDGADKVRDSDPVAGNGTGAALVEIDLLINYGMREKALGLLLSLETCDPRDKEVRQRLLSLYKAGKENTKAAEQCLLLSALHRSSRNEETAENYLDQAKLLDPDLVEAETDLSAFARRHGIELESSPAGESARGEHEVDLSSDLLDIFFSGDGGRGGSAEEEMPEVQAMVTDTFAPDVPPSSPPARSVEEQLQEVDFYIRLGFRDEALAKLNEIARTSPNSPELQSRYERLGEAKPAAVHEIIAPASAERAGQASIDALDIVDGDKDAAVFGQLAQSGADDSFEIFSEMDIKSTLDRFVEERPVDLQEDKGFELQLEEISRAADIAQQFDTPLTQTEVPQALEKAAGNGGFHSNEMFADLMAEVGANETIRDSFEDHFSLGTAYRDMELTEDAIREFQLALKSAESAKDTRKMVQCCGMLSTCYLNKGMPTSALRWCQSGLNVEDISSHEAMALRYDMGVAHSMSGSSGRALECFDQIFGLDPGYRDVAQRIDELKACHQ